MHVHLATPSFCVMAARPTDYELSERLKALGVNAGPITNTTRDVYFRKLKKLTTNSTPLHETPLHETPPKISRPITPPVTPPPLSPPPLSPPPLSPVTTPPPSLLETGRHNSSQAIVDQLLVTFDTKHVANDAAFLFPGGEMILASRAILATQCANMIPILFTPEVPYSVKVMTLSGNVCEFLIRPTELVVDLKEKISISQGLTVPEQRLVFMDQELPNTSTFQGCGVLTGATIHLVLVASEIREPSLSYTCPAMNPSLSIYHFHVELGLEYGGDIASPPHHPSLGSTPLPSLGSAPLPSHVAHLVHVYDAHYSAFRMFFRYLYCGEFQDEGSENLRSYVVCYVLGELFHLSSLIQSCLSIIISALTVESAQYLLVYSETIHKDSLRDICLRFLNS